MLRYIDDLYYFMYFIFFIVFCTCKNTFPDLINVRAYIIIKKEPIQYHVSLVLTDTTFDNVLMLVDIVYRYVL